jgi:hypothetical protein
MLADMTWGEGIAALSIVVSTVNTIVLYRISQAQKRYERLEDTSDKKISNLGDALHATTTKLIDERFRGMTHEMMSHVQGFTSALDEMKERLKEGDGELSALGQVDQKIEIQLIERMSAMKQWFIENLASKTDLKEHEKAVAQKFDRMGERMGELGREVAVLTDRAKR